MSVRIIPDTTEDNFKPVIHDICKKAVSFHQFNSNAFYVEFEDGWWVMKNHIQNCNPFITKKVAHTVLFMLYHRDTLAQFGFVKDEKEKEIVKYALQFLIANLDNEIEEDFQSHGIEVSESDIDEVLHKFTLTGAMDLSS